MLWIALGILLVHSVGGDPLVHSEIARPRSSDIDYRLPKTLRPLLYYLSIQPNFEKRTFKGRSSVVVDVLQDTLTITIHQDELKIKQEHIEIMNLNNNRIKITVNSIELEQDRHFLHISLATNMKKGEKYTIYFHEYEGKLHTDNRGIYLAHFKDQSMNNREFVTTQFEPTGARRAFPCFDEPEYKAAFDVTLVTPDKNYVAISNMRQDKQLDRTYAFERSPKMSTYLVAFIISEMKLNPDKGDHRVLAKPQDIDAGKASCAQRIGKTTLEKLEEYLGVSYGLDKMDQAAVPDEYFKSGAMENWGLVIYRESALLCSEETTALRHQSITTIIAHEYAHQWFGNLVSPAWWKYIWLNEGFATYFENIAADLVNPDMDIMKQYLVKSVQSVLFDDSFTSTRELNMDAGSPDEIWALFDTIAYNKGGAIVRMMDGFMTTPIFKKAIRNYLTKMEYKVATPLLLYKAMQEILDGWDTTLPASHSLADIMSTWENKKGYPLVTVTRDYGQSENNVHLSQARFLMLGENPPKVVWTIPVNFVSANYPSFNRTTPDVWLTGGEDFVTVPYVSDNDWIIANKKQTGYYRVNYDEKNWNLIKKALLGDHNKIDVLNRAQIIDDTFMLARSRQLAYDIPISIGLYLKQEKDYVAFYPFYRAIGYLDNILYSTNGRDKLKEYVNNVLQDTYKQLHFNENVNDKHTDKLNRINVLNWICKMDHADCRSTCLDKFRAWKDRKAIIPVNLQLSVFCGAMRVGSKHDHSTLHKAAKELKLDDRDLRSAMITSLGCSENEEILHSYLNSALEKDAVFGPDLVFPSVYTGGGVGVQAVLNLLLKQGKFEKLQQRSENIEDLLNGIASRISGDNQFEQLTRLSVTHDKSLFKRALEIAKTNKEWFSANGPALLEALDKANGSTLLTNIFILTIVSAATSIFYY